MLSCKPVALKNIILGKIACTVFISPNVFCCSDYQRDRNNTLRKDTCRRKTTASPNQKGC